MRAVLGLKLSLPIRCLQLLPCNLLPVHHENYSQDIARAFLNCPLLAVQGLLGPGRSDSFLLSPNDLEEPVLPESWLGTA